MSDANNNKSNQRAADARPTNAKTAKQRPPSKNKISTAGGATTTTAKETSTAENITTKSPPPPSRPLLHNDVAGDSHCHHRGEASVGMFTPQGSSVVDGDDGDVTLGAIPAELAEEIALVQQVYACRITVRKGGEVVAAAAAISEQATTTTAASNQPLRRQHIDNSNKTKNSKNKKCFGNDCCATTADTSIPTPTEPEEGKEKEKEKGPWIVNIEVPCAVTADRELTATLRLAIPRGYPNSSAPVRPQLRLPGGHKSFVLSVESTLHEHCLAAAEACSENNTGNSGGGIPVLMSIAGIAMQEISNIPRGVLADAYCVCHACNRAAVQRARNETHAALRKAHPDMEAHEFQATLRGELKSVLKNPLLKIPQPASVAGGHGGAVKCLTCGGSDALLLESVFFVPDDLFDALSCAFCFTSDSPLIMLRTKKRGSGGKGAAESTAADPSSSNTIQFGFKKLWSGPSTSSSATRGMRRPLPLDAEYSCCECFVRMWELAVGERALAKPLPLALTRTSTRKVQGPPKNTSDDEVLFKLLRAVVGVPNPNDSQVVYANPALARLLPDRTYQRLQFFALQFGLSASLYEGLGLPVPGLRTCPLPHCTAAPYLAAGDFWLSLCPLCGEHHCIHCELVAADCRCDRAERLRNSWKDFGEAWKEEARCLALVDAFKLVPLVDQARHYWETTWSLDDFVAAKGHMTRGELLSAPPLPPPPPSTPSESSPPTTTAAASSPLVPIMILHNGVRHVVALNLDAPPIARIDGRPATDCGGWLVDMMEAVGTGALTANNRSAHLGEHVVVVCQGAVLNWRVSLRQNGVLPRSVLFLIQCFKQDTEFRLCEQRLALSLVGVGTDADDWYDGAQKPCPGCKRPVVHYYGHGCHIISNCHTYTHKYGKEWCFVCGCFSIGHKCPNQCSMVCKPGACTCVLCPDCKPMFPCDLCTGCPRCCLDTGAGNDDLFLDF